MTISSGYGTDRALGAAADSSPGSILRETVATVRAALGGDCAGLRVERVVFELFFTGVKLSNGAG